MKSKIFFILMIALSTKAFAQKIESKIDKFTGQKRIETAYSPLSRSITGGIGANFRSVDSTLFISFNGSIGCGVVNTSDATVLLFEDNSTVKVYPISLQSYDISGSTNVYDQQYHIYKDDVKTIASKKIISLRRYYNNNYIDIDIKEKWSTKFKELGNNFLAELNK